MTTTELRAELVDIAATLGEVIRMAVASESRFRAPVCAWKLTALAIRESADAIDERLSQIEKEKSS